MGDGPEGEVGMRVQFTTCQGFYLLRVLPDAAFRSPWDCGWFEQRLW